MAPEVMQAGEDGAELMNAVGDMNSHYSSDGEGNGNDSKRKYGRKADIWSLGMTLCELANGSPPFKTAAAAIFAVCVSKKWPSFPEIFSDVAHSFLARCLVYEPKRRADCQELQEHPFMKPKVCYYYCMGYTSVSDSLCHHSLKMKYVLKQHYPYNNLNQYHICVHLL